MMKKRLLIWCMMHLILSTTLLAQELAFTAQAPKQVVVGKPFAVTYSINRNVGDMRAPEFTDFDVLAGPYQSTSMSSTYVNGRHNATYNTTFTYTLRAKREGSFTLQPASTTIEGKRVQSNGLKITVLPADKEAEQAAANTSATNSQNASSDNNQRGGEMFVRAILSKNRVMEQEPLTLTYKLYFANVDIAQLMGAKIPEINGVVKQEIDLGDRQVEMEHYNNRNYQTYVLYQTLIYPQHSGDIHIDPASFEAIIRIANRRQVRSILDYYDTYQEVSKTVTAPAVNIHVDALPAGKPADYSGTVGHLTLNSEISATEIPANEAITLKVTIQGTGNMKLIKTPVIDWPEGFEAYDPKVTNSFKTTASGMSGTKTIEYLVIPRATGDYTIPASHLSYYDITEKVYKTLATPEYTIHVLRPTREESTSGEGDANYSNYVNKEDIRKLGSDIRYIHTGSAKAAAAQQFTLSKMTIALLYLVPALVALIVLLVMRKRIQLLGDAKYMHLRHAKRSARQHLKAAKKAEGDVNFWTEIEHACRACEPYVDVTEVLQTAEFARYAPSAAEKQDEIYHQTKQLIDQLETIKL